MNANRSGGQRISSSSTRRPPNVSQVEPIVGPAEGVSALFRVVLGSSSCVDMAFYRRGLTRDRGEEVGVNGGAFALDLESGPGLDVGVRG